MAFGKKYIAQSASMSDLLAAESAFKGMSQAEREAIVRLVSTFGTKVGYKALCHMIKGMPAYALKPAEAQVEAYKAEMGKNWALAAEIWDALTHADNIPDAKAKADACRAKIAQAAQVVSKASTDKRQSEKQALVDQATKLGINGAKGMAVKTLKALIARKQAELGNLPVEQATPALDEVQAK